VVGLGLLIEVLALGDEGDILAPMALARGHGPQGAVVMDLVVPLNEAGDPGTGLMEVLKGLVRGALGDFRALKRASEYGSSSRTVGRRKEGMTPSSCMGPV